MEDKLMFPEQIEPVVGPAVDGQESIFSGKGPGIRAFAYFLDTAFISATNFLMSTVVLFVIGFIGAVAGRQLSYQTMTPGSFYFNLFLILLISLIYFTLFEGLYGATPGKLILGMRVVKEDGSPCYLRTALHRGLWRYIDAFFLGLVAITNMHKPLQQRLGDKKAHTVVISRHDLSPESARDWSSFFVAALLFLSGQSVVLFIFQTPLFTFLPGNGLSI